MELAPGVTKGITLNPRKADMSKKPWAIYVLAILQFAAPVVSLVMNAALSDISIGRYLQILMSEPPAELFGYFGVPVLAGLAIWSVRLWSFPVFIGALGFGAYSNFMEWKAYPDAIPAWLLATVYVFNIAMVTYFLIPQVRRVYFDRRVRWWQTVPRYTLEFDALCSREGKEIPIQVKNLSMGGIFFASDSQFHTGDHLTFRFSLFSQPYEFRGEVVHLMEGKTGYGVRFNHTRETAKLIKRLAGGLDALRVPRRPEYSTLERHVGRSKEVAHEIVHFLRTGEGLIPHLPPSEKKSA